VRSKRESDDIQVLDDWYQRNCNGLWEHHGGIRIETCDNPGWLATIKDLPRKKETNLAHLQSLLKNLDVEIRDDVQEIRVFARSLRHCLAAMARLIELGSNSK
jgi:hypothetical protein